MQFKKLLFFIISVTFVITGCDSKPVEENKNVEKIEVEKKIVKKKQTKFTLTTLNSETLNLEIIDKQMKINELQGKVILLNFFATWCPPCKAEIPHLNNLKNKYKDNFEILAINVGDRDGVMTDNAKIKSFVKDYSINYAVTNEKENLNIVEAMGDIRTIPTMFLFDASGDIVQKYVGIVPEEMIETDIKKAIGNK